MIFARKFFRDSGIMPSSGGLFTAAIIGAVYVVDRITKYIVTIKMNEGESIPILKGIFHLTLVHNTGGAFGMMKGWSYVFTAAAVIFIIVAVSYVSFRWFSMTLRDKAAVCLVVGGTLGNLSDRLKLGYVVDLFDFRVWPVFNVADSCITVGAALLIFSILMSSREKNKQCTQ